MSWTLPTRSGEYVVDLAPRGEGLVTVGWGPPGSRHPRRTASSSFETDLDVLPMEATALGTRTVHGAELVVRRGDGVRGARLALAGEVRLVEDDGGTHLVCPLADPVAGLEVDLHVRTHSGHDVVLKWAEVRNASSHVLELRRAWGGAFTVPVAPGAAVGLLGGTWAREYTPFAVGLGAGTLSVGSRQGITSHTYAPVVSVMAPGRDGEGADADVGARYGVALAWSGSWRLVVDAVPLADHVRVAGGSDDESAVLALAPGDSLTTPTLAGVRVDGGTDDLAQAWHDYERTLARSTGPEHRPVVYNSWYATTFDVRLDHQLALADAASGLGAEVFVVDDGWFRGRTSDRAGLGDWEADEDRLPGGLGRIAAEVSSRGMRFGLWVEPEAVSPDSDLYRAHPDWVHHVAGRPLRALRHQYVLDLGLEQVEAWVAGTLRRLLGSYPITYLKWDMNRAVADGGQSVPDGDDWSWRHTQAYYRVLDMLRDEFPHVTVEACAGGGGRVDLAVLPRTDVVWTSDETGPRDRLAIQHGFLGAFPAWTMSSWVTDMPDQRDPDPASLEFRFVVAMAGVLGIGADLLAWDSVTRERAASMVDLYRSIRGVVHGGRVRRHGTPSELACAVQYTGARSVVVLAWRRHDGRLRVHLGDLDDGARYRVRPDGVVRTAEELLGDGLDVRWTWGDCDVVVLDRI